MKNVKLADPTAVFSRLVGNNIQRAREIIAQTLVQWRVTPNTLTFLGLLATLLACACLAAGAGAKPGDPRRIYQWEALLLLILASAFDILDGAVARNSEKITAIGGFLDSTVDRIADGAIYAGIAGFYLFVDTSPHRGQMVILTFIALINAELISYVKARAENCIPSCSVGFWQRGERLAAILIGLAFGHTPTVLLMMAVLPAFTALRRVVFTLQQLRLQAVQQPLLNPKAKPQGWYRLALWRYPRGHIGYDITVVTNIAIIILVDWPITRS